MSAINDVMNNELAKAGLTGGNTIDESVEAMFKMLLNNMYPAVTVASEASNVDMFGDGVTVADMQTGVTLVNNVFTGTIKKLTSGALADHWGEGYFIALKFTKVDPDVVSVKVGLDPSVGSGLVELDADMNGGFKITNRKQQMFKVVATKADGTTVESSYVLSALAFEE